jgi:hypothetical protein
MAQLTTQFFQDGKSKLAAAFTAEIGRHEMEMLPFPVLES